MVGYGKPKDAARKRWFKRWFPALTPESEDLLHLDYLRIIAALALVAHHVAPFIEVPAGYPSLETFRGTFETLDVLVDLFFVISGVVISWVYAQRMNTTSDYAQFLLKRVGRLVPLHWVTLGFYAAIGLVFALGLVKSETPGIIDWSCFAQNALLLHSAHTCSNLSFNIVSWSISAEMTMYVLFPLLLFFMNRSLIGSIVLVVVIVGALDLFTMAAGGNPWWEWSWDFGFIRALPSFLFGMVLYAGREYLARFKMPVWCFHLLVASCFVVSFVGATQIGVLLLAWATVAAALMRDVQKRTDPLVRAGAPLGQLTYSIYMLHPPVITVMYLILAQRVLHLEGMAMNLMLLASVPVIFAVSYLSLIHFETPARKWVGALGKRIRAQPRPKPVQAT